MTNVGIRAKDVVVNKGVNHVLRSISFTVEPGRLTGLIGPSGSGKTTLMRSVVGIQLLTSGTLKVNGYNAGSSELRSEIGYVTQSPAVYDDLTVEQNLHYFAVLIDAPRDSVSRVLHDVDLEPQTHQLTNTLSGGQRARVSLAVALLGDPSVLVLDEPTVGLDPVLRDRLWKLFRRLARDGKTILISSHVMDEADRCDDVLLLRDGELLWSESREALLKKVKAKNTDEAFLKVVQEARV